MSIAGVDLAVANMAAAAGALRAGCIRGVAEGLSLVLSDATELVPVDTGQLRTSLYTRTEPTAGGAAGAVGAGAEYAVYVEMGTGAHGAASGGKAPGATYTMDHPGQEAQPFLYPAYKANQADIVAAVEDAIREALNG